MIEISTDIIKEAVYNLCFQANTCLDEKVYKKILDTYNNAEGESREILKYILLNAQIAYDEKRPLCQDTGQVIVFVEIGQNVRLIGEFLEEAINSAVEKCYKDNFFRKSVVKNAVFDRSNTKTNTPVIINIKIVKNDGIRLSVLIKGAGSENKSNLKMLLPTITREELVKECSDMILQAGENACPPMFIGIGVGGSADKALLMSKEAFIDEENTQDELILAEEIKKCVNAKSSAKYKNNYVLDVKIKTSHTHIASMPIGITINCHSDRVSKCMITNEGVKYYHKIPDFIEIEDDKQEIKEIFVENIESVKALKQGEKALLTGEIYVARDMAHKKMLEDGCPIDIKDKIIFYAGPCPNRNGEIIGSVGPTTASRMDKYAIELYKQGLLATIGKGSRNEELKNLIKSQGGKYFTVIGGIAAYLSNKVKSREVIAYEELGPEALLKIYVEKFPVFVSI